MEDFDKAVHPDSVVMLYNEEKLANGFFICLNDKKELVVVTDLVIVKYSSRAVSVAKQFTRYADDEIVGTSQSDVPYIVIDQHGFQNKLFDSGVIKAALVLRDKTIGQRDFAVRSRLNNQPA
jgi:hypothetical protein